MLGINRVTLLGNLGADPDVKKTASASGQKTMTLFNVATSNAWTNKEGQRQEHTEWHRIVVWGKLAETCAEYLSKGRKVYVEGRLQTRSWEDDNNQKRYTTEIVASQVLFLNSPEKKNYESTGQKYPKEPKDFSGNPDSQADNKGNKDNIPF